MNIFGKYNPKTKKIEVDTEAGDKIAEAICYTSAAAGGAAVCGAVAGPTAAAGGAAVAAVALREVDKHYEVFDAPVEIIDHESPVSISEIGEKLPPEVKDMVGQIGGVVSGAVAGKDGSTTHGLNIKVENMGKGSTAKIHSAVIHNSCMAKPKVPAARR